MSFPNILKIVFVIAVGFFSGYQLTQEFDPPAKQPNRTMASATFSKLGQDQVADQFLELKADLSLLALKNTETSEVSVKLTALKNISDGLTYKWRIPAHVKLLEGNRAGQIPNLKAGEVIELKIKLSDFSKESRRYISLKVHGTSNSLQLKKEMLLSSRMEDAIEYKLHQSEIKKENQINSFSKKKNKFSPENVIR